MAIVTKTWIIKIRTTVILLAVVMRKRGREVIVGRFCETPILDRRLAQTPYIPFIVAIPLLGFENSRSRRGHGFMRAFTEFLDHLLVERRNIIRLTARHQSVVHH